MKMQPVQVRLSEAQIEMLDRKVREQKYPNRSEAIRDYLRKAQLWEVLEKLLEFGDIEEQSEQEIRENLSRIRRSVYQEILAPDLEEDPME